jgi:hypothetical protein
MNVKDLIAQLQDFDPELEVLCYAVHDSLLASGHMFRLMDIQRVLPSEGERRTAHDGLPTMAFGHTGSSQQVVFIHVTPEF